MDVLGDEVETLRYEVDVLRRRMEASIARRDAAAALLIGVCKTMIAERETRIRKLEHELGAQRGAGQADENPRSDLAL